MKSHGASFAAGCVIATIASMIAIGCGDDETSTTGSPGSTATTTSSSSSAATGTGGAGGAGTGGEGGAGQGGGGGGDAGITAVIEAKSGSNVSGTATFTTDGTKVTVTVNVQGVMMPGEHGVHIHETGDCSAADAMSAGAHWNPTMKMHGKWGVDPFHLGDIGNITIDANGEGTLTLTTDLWSLGTGEMNDVFGHAILVHDMKDDFTSQPAGGAGTRIGCGVIGLKK